jgi:hypothetical protein
VSLQNSKRKIARPPVYKDRLFELTVVLTPLRMCWTIPLRKVIKAQGNGVKNETGEACNIFYQNDHSDEAHK